MPVVFARALTVAVLLATLAAPPLMRSSVGLAQTAAPSSTPAPAPTDPYVWLEDPRGERALSWVRAENAKTLGVLEKDPRFGGVFADALKIEEAKDRLALPQFLQ